MATIKYKDENGQWQEIAIGGGGGLELRELKMSGSADDNAYNLETLELMRENKVPPAMNAGDGTLVPMTYGGNGQFILQVAQMGIEMQMSVTMAVDGSITMSQDFIAPYVLNSPSKVLEWLIKSKALAQVGMHEPVYVIYNALLCLVDCIQAGVTGSTRAVVQFNFGSQRFERVYDATTGEEISTTEIPLGGGTGDGLEYLEFDDPTTADEVMSIISTIQQRYDTTGKMPVAWINGNGGHSLISQIIYQSERDGVLVTRLMDSEVMYFVTSGALLVVQSSLVMRLDASASDNNKMVAALLQLVSFTQWQMFNIPIYLEIDGVMYEAVSKSKEINGTVYGSFVVGNTLKIYKLTHSQNGVYVPLLMSEIPLGGGGGGGSITLDSEMSDTSENAVQNKVIKSYVDGLVGDVNSLLDTINGEEV